MFMCQFQGAHKYATLLSRLASIKQGPSETLKSYVKHFNDKLTMIHNPQENGVMMATISGVQPDTPFWDKLQKDECKSLLEFYMLADKIMSLYRPLVKPYKQGSLLPLRRAMIMEKSEKKKRSLPISREDEQEDQGP